MLICTHIHTCTWHQDKCLVLCWCLNAWICPIIQTHACIHVCMYCGGHILSLAKCSIYVYWGMCLRMRPSMFAVAQWVTVISPDTHISAAIVEQYKGPTILWLKQNSTLWILLQDVPHLDALAYRMSHIWMHLLTHLHITMSIQSKMFIYIHQGMLVYVYACLRLYVSILGMTILKKICIYLSLHAHTQTYSYSRQPRGTRIQARKTDRLLYPVLNICLQRTACVYACATWLPMCVCAYASCMDRLHQALDLLLLYTILRYAEMCVYVCVYIYIYILREYVCTVGSSVAVHYIEVSSVLLCWFPRDRQT
jgi:hypothetical protein